MCATHYKNKVVLADARMGVGLAEDSPALFDSNYSTLESWHRAEGAEINSFPARGGAPWVLGAQN